jgi:hypothetical protein
MRSNMFKTLKTAVLAISVLLLGASVSFAQVTVGLTAAPTTAILPDGNTVQMWGYTCAAGSTNCAALNTTPLGGWSPVVITVPTGQGLTVNLTNSLPVPTSLVIVGQADTGLGTSPGMAGVTPHTDSSVSWPIAGGTGFNPPPQGSRVRSFSTEVGATSSGSVQWVGLRPGTYLLESGTHPSIQGPMGLYGIVVVTAAPAGATAGCAYPGATAGACAVSYNSELPLLFSEIDPIQNAAVALAVAQPGFSESTVWSGQPGGCGTQALPNCYPPAVNYKPLYYLINGRAFDRTNLTASLYAATAGLNTATPPVPVTTGIFGNVLVRLVNAGLRMHVPSIVGSVSTPAVAGGGAKGTVAAPGFSLVAEDGNPLPGVSRVQSEVFMAAGKTYDVMIDVPTAVGTALPIFDRELSLSSNSIGRDGGMLAYIGVNGALAPVAAASAAPAAKANNDNYAVIPGGSLVISDPAKGVLGNDVSVYGAQVQGGPIAGLTTFNPDGTFTYTGAGTSFTYCGNGTTSASLTPICATVTIGAAATDSASNITCSVPGPFTSNLSTTISVAPPGLLAGCKDALGYALKVTGVSAQTGIAVTPDPTGGFSATASPAGGTATFSFTVQSAFGASASTVIGPVTVNFLPASNLVVKVTGGDGKSVTDYRWIIEEDRTFYINPLCTTNPPAAGCPGAAGIVPTFGTNFHTSYMPLIAAGCTGQLSCESGQTLLGTPAVCDGGNGVCRTGASQQVVHAPAEVHLDPTKRYYISVLPGDAANSFENVNSCLDDTTADCGHGMGGAPIACSLTGTEVACSTTDSFANVNVLVQPNPFPPAKLSVFVFEDDFPLNGEQDGGGGIDVLSPNEPGLGGFNIKLFDDAGGTGDATGQMSYDMFNMPLSNSLAGTLDPSTGIDACPLSAQITANMPSNGGDGSQAGITGEIVTCPKYEADGLTLSPLAGQAVVANLMPGRYGVVATPAADRIARGEEWLQTNTLDGQKAHDSFLRIGEPSFFQEYGPSGFHVSIGFANPAIINARRLYVCNGRDANAPNPGQALQCNNTVTGTVTTERMSRTPDERLFSSGDNSSFSFSQCYVSFGDPDGEDFAFTKCNADGSFTLSGLPNGEWRVTVFDQWNDMLVDGLSTPVGLSGGRTVNMGQIATNQWQANLYTSTFFDQNGNGIQDGSEPGLGLVATNIRFRDGSYSNFNNTDLFGSAGFNEIFPLFSWYVVETDTTRYKSTGVHVVYDAGGPADGTAGGGSSTVGHFMSNTVDPVPLPVSPTDVRVPGALYCATADCTGAKSHTQTTTSTGRIDPPLWFGTEGWQGFSGQNTFLDFGKKPFAPGETGTIHGEVIYASTRPFDDPTLLIHTSWTPDVPNVPVNLYKVGTAPDGTESYTLVDTTKTSSWDDWAQGFRSNGVPNMNCPGQGTNSGTRADLFYFSLFNQPMWLDAYNNGGTPAHTIPYSSQYKCYDGMHNWNQVQPAPYDGMYSFPSVTSFDANGKPNGTNCTGCTTNPDTSDPYRSGTPMLLPGKYVVEIVVPPGYELVKEEDKNILIGDNYIAPATAQFAGLGNIFIMPDQAEVASLYNANNPQNPTNTMGRTTLPNGEGDTGSVEIFWPCVGAMRQVPDFISLFPQSGEVAPFAGAMRPLCDRKEVLLTEQQSVLAKFWVFSSTHVAAHFTGVITDDYTSEFDPFSPQFGEKFSPPDLPISIKDWSGTEIARTYADHWGTYDGLNYSTWEVNPPNPTGYAPTMMVTCMNDPGPIPGPGGTMITDPLFNPEYSQFCYEIPFMPGQTQYMDTPVVPTSAFAGAGYNNPDCAYPNLTPAIKEVDGDGIGPWVSAAGHTITITALGDLPVPNNAYSGPAASAPPYNQKTITRHYGFGSTAGKVVLVDSTGASYPLGSVSWNDTTITGTVPGTLAACPVQQQAQYGGSATQCGQLVITAAGGQASVDTVTVTVGGKAPNHIAATDFIQTAIDKASPGDLLIVNPGAHNELVIMWKPVRLQGVGAASSVINANTHPAGKINDWRTRVDCLMGLGPDGASTTWNASCGAGWNFFTAQPNVPQDDRLPLEAAVGWTASLNGNLAELLQEPSLMGALEGAGITVLSKGLDFHGADPWTDGSEPGGFPPTTTLLQNVLGTFPPSSNHCSDTTNPFPSNFMCNPSSIDGLTITDSSQGGGAIFVHGWGHNIQIANNRVQNNAGTLSGGINVGQGEFPPSYIQGGATNAAPGSCRTSSFDNQTNSQLPYCHDVNVNVHHNYITDNSSTGDELFSATPAGAGGISFCTGSDFYKFNYNWICGNLSSGDGGGFGHLGFSYNGDVEHNMFLFNQSTNPTIATNGGAMIIMGAPDVDPTCGATTDTDCVPTPASIGPGDGTGPGLVINANMVIGNQAESGSGGGIALQAVNGSESVAFKNSNCGSNLAYPNCRWNSVQLTNNIIVNNVSGWDGGGVSLLDALAVNIVNNTIMHNDSTASSGVLFDTIGAPLASTRGTNCRQAGNTASCPQPAGLVTIPNSAVLQANLTGSVTCPTGHGSSGGNATCKRFSVPLLDNDVIFQNRSYYVGVGALGAGTLNQQKLVTLFNAFTNTAAPTQASTGACPAASYWDIGVRGDTSPTNHSGGLTLSPIYSFLTSITGYPGNQGTPAVATNSASNPAVSAAYCNGSRIPPEFGGTGWQVPPGIADATVPNPVFALTPTATVDEGNNWVNISWGPLALMGPTHMGSGTTTPDVFLGNYAPTSGAPTVNFIPNNATNTGTNGAYTLAPQFDFFGHLRKDGHVDAGAIEFGAGGGGGTPASVSISPNPLTITFPTPVLNFGSGNGVVTFTNTSSVASGSTVTIGSVAVNSGAGAGPLAWFFLKTADNCTGVTLQPQQFCTVTVNFTNVFAGVGVDRPGTIVFTDDATGSPQTGNLIGHANP